MVVLFEIEIGILPIYVVFFNKIFMNFPDLWSSNVMDSELVEESNKIEKYCPITEDISLDDTTLCSAVERIENE